MISDVSKLLVIGINHKTASITERERLQINSKEIRHALLYFKSIADVEGVVIVSTCNRLEFYFVIKNEINPFQLLNYFYRREKGIGTPVTNEHFYLYTGINTARHLFKVICGLDSMVIGEYQIQGQIKDAYSIACSEKTADKILHKLFHAAFRTGKAVRTNTRIGQGNKSLSGITFKLVKEKLSKNDPVTIIGVNQNTKIIAQKLYEAGFSRLIFVNRTFYKAEEMAEKFTGQAFSLEFLKEALMSSKCIISCTGSPDFIIQSNLINNIHSEKGFPKLIIDMAVPRDINTRGLSDEVQVFDLEGLSRYLEKEKRDIILDIPVAERIIEDESNLFEAWNEAQYDNTFTLLDEKIESVRLQLLNELKYQIPEDEFKRLDKFSRSLTHRMKSTITQAVKINLDDTGIYKAG